MTQGSHDYGGDIIAIKDQIKYVIQCKKYSSPVGIDAVQQVDGVEIAEIKSAYATPRNENTPTSIDARYRPTAGYLVANSLSINMKEYDE